MAKRYRGQGGVSTVRPGGHPEEIFFLLKIEPGQIRFLKYILEGHDHLGFMVPISGKEGIVGLHTTRSQYNQMKLILQNLPFPISFL